MGFDAQLKRYFPLIICAMVAAAAYLQASGIGQLVASSIAEAPSSSPTAARRGKDLSANKANAGPILSRNPFDSVTGPLDGTALTVPDGGIPEPEKPDADPGLISIEDPKCDFGRVLFITTSDDIDWSFAAIADKSGKSALRRRGDEVEGHTVYAMVWNRVWLTSGTNRCQLELGDKPKHSGVTTRPGKKIKRIKKRRGRGRRIPPEMAAKIHKVSDTEFNVERSVVDEILENQATLMRSARIVPEKSGDKVVGIRMFGIRNGTLLDHLGFRNGDRLQTINGFEITNPQKALEAYGRLRTADGLKVSIVRRGKPVTIDFNIQ